MNQIRVILVDDHQIVIDGISGYLKEDDDFHLVAECLSGDEALQAMKHNPCDVMLMDINMPEMDGNELAAKMRKLYPQVHLICLTMSDNYSQIKKMMELGVKGYLLKSTGKDNIKSAIKKVNSGDTFFGYEVTQIILDSLSKSRPRKSTMSSEIPLTNREKEILSLIVKEFSNSEIAEKLFISVRTVEAHKRNLLEKTGSRNTAGLVLYSIDKGLISNSISD